MYDYKKFWFFLQLLTNSVTASDIQEWAEKQLDDDPTDTFVLDLCFCQSEIDILSYFYQLKLSELSIHFSEVALNFLKNYLAELNLNTIDTTQCTSHIFQVYCYIQDDLLEIFFDEWQTDFIIEEELNIDLKATELKFISALKQQLLT